MQQEKIKALNTGKQERVVFTLEKTLLCAPLWAQPVFPHAHLCDLEGYLWNPHGGLLYKYTDMWKLCNMFIC